MKVLRAFKKLINKGKWETVPKAARRCRACTTVLTALALLPFAAPAFAQGGPSFTYAKPDEINQGAPPPPPVEGKASIKGGILFTTGNSETTNGSLALSVSRKESANRFTLDASLAYGRSNILVPDVSPAAPSARSATTCPTNGTSRHRRARSIPSRFNLPACSSARP